MKAQTLAQDVGWEPSGHLSEVALSAAADGEDTLLDAAMHDHLGSCDACALRLGEVALRSAEVAEAFAEVREHADALALVKVPAAKPARAPERRRVPMLAIVAALVVAMLGAAPSMLSAPQEAAQTWSVVRKVAPSFVRLLPQALERAWSGPRGPMMVFMWGLTVVLVAMGFAIAKRASKKALVDGGRQS